MRLSKYEKETIILTNEEDSYYSVYTSFNQGLQKRLKKFSEKYPDYCCLSRTTEEGSETYIIQKGRLSLNLRPPYTDARKESAGERIDKARIEHLEDAQDSI